MAQILKLENNLYCEYEVFRDLQDDTIFHLKKTSRTYKPEEFVNASAPESYSLEITRKRVDAEGWLCHKIAELIKENYVLVNFHRERETCPSMERAECIKRRASYIILKRIKGQGAI